jgi:tetratricopeptide (TPR) repeat protein
MPVASARAIASLTSRPALALVLAALFLLPRQGEAQALLPKRTLTAGVAPGCGPTAAAPVQGQRDNAEARRLAAEGQQAALVGDRMGARAAFARAAALNPGDERIAYDLGRAHEELADTTAAVGEYCHYLALSAMGREAPDVRARLGRLTPRRAIEDAGRAAEAFRVGLAHYDARRYQNAAESFSETVRRSPPAIEAVFDRALARSALGQRTDAVRDLEAYLIGAPNASDRAAVLRAIDALRRPVYNSSTAFTRGLLPGFGQMYTGRPGRGVVVLAAVAGTVAMAFYQRTESRQVPYVDPNGVPVPYTVSDTKRPYLLPALGAGAAITVLAAFEASRFARSTQSGVTRVSGFVGPRGDLGLRVAARF